MEDNFDKLLDDFVNNYSNSIKKLNKTSKKAITMPNFKRIDEYKIIVKLEKDLDNKEKLINKLIEENKSLVNRLDTLVEISVNKKAYNKVCADKEKQGKLLKTTEEALALYKSNYLTLKDKIDKFNSKFWVYVFNLYIK